MKVQPDKAFWVFLQYLFRDSVARTGIFLALITFHTCGIYCTFLRLPALVEAAWTAARSAVSCWVSLFEGQELPALLLSPAHDNNTKRGKTSPADDRKHSHGPKTFKPGGRESD